MLCGTLRFQIIYNYANCLYSNQEYCLYSTYKSYITCPYSNLEYCLYLTYEGYMTISYVTPVRF
jgi:hypothetical protein